MALDIHTANLRLKLADDETEIDLTALQGLWSVAQYLTLNIGSSTHLMTASLY
jgi:hypothetical protein